MKIVEVFESVQGEGHLQGYWCTFVRLAGCNLNCPWCDEPEHKDKSKVREVDPKELAKSIKTQLIVVTGGEPTLQTEELFRFAQCLPPGTAPVIESNGTADPAVYLRLIKVGYDIVVSPKPQAKFRFPQDIYIACLKFVVDDDFWEWSKTEEALKVLNSRTVYLQPCDSQDAKAVATSVERILDLSKRFPLAKAGIQMHKAYSKMMGEEVK